MFHVRARRSLIAAVAVAGLVTPVAPAAAAPTAAPARTPAGPTVTLLTGDSVTVGGPDGVRVRAAKGREHLTFHRRTDERGDVHVIPEDALALVASGKLDPRLFDVTGLVRAGYDDRSRSDLPLIVDYPGATPRTAGARVVRELPAVSATAVVADRTPAYWAQVRDSARRVWLDGPVAVTLDRSVAQIGAPAAWAAGHTGAGTTVAVLDTGIDATHPELSDAVVGAKNFTGADSEDDRFGHGTHVASTITGGSAATPGRYRGVAPDARLLNGKVLDDNGGGQESWIIAGMEWAAASGADVINMSLGSSMPTDGTDPMSAAVNRITEETGALFVISAGNSGPSDRSIGSPGAADAALTVGAVDREDDLASFSSRGPRWEDGAIKPDLTAPGVGIVAARAEHGQIGDPVDDDHVSMSGTSMAAPHVAGAAAILAGQHPDWSASQLKSALMGSAKANDTLTVFEQGAGRVDVVGAVDTTVLASPASISNGIAQWPHDDDQPITKTVTYTNTGTEPVTLDLALDVTGPDGQAAPAGMFTLEPAAVTVPAGGQASATVTTDTRVDARDGTYSGVVTASGGDRTVRTPIAVEREVESYDVDLTFLDHDGKPTGLYFHRFVDVNVARAYLPHDEDGTVTARLPKGEYYFEATVQTERGQYDWIGTDFTEPAFVVTGDAEFTFDARQGKPLGFTVDRPNADEGIAITEAAMTTAWGATGTTAFMPNFDKVLMVPSRTSAPGRFRFAASTFMAERNGDGFDGSPYLYNLRKEEDGRVPENLLWRVPDRQLAKVRSTYAVSSPGLLGEREGFLTFPLPHTLTEYHSPNVPLRASFAEVTEPNGFPVADSSRVEPRTYQLGRTVEERWNVGVFGPAFPLRASDPAYFAGRVGDLLGASLPLLSDQVDGRAGSPYGTGTTTLLRDGEVVGESPYGGFGVWDVPAAEADYTLRTTLTRPPAARLSTQVSAEWTFRSGHVTGDVAEPLPLLAVRYAPDLDEENTARAGKRFRFPVYVQRNGSADTNGVGTPTVEVSYDDGTSWRSVRLSRERGGWVATVDHPRGAEFVSLRSSVADRDGNTAGQTILRAYALR